MKIMLLSNKDLEPSKTLTMLYMCCQIAEEVLLICFVFLGCVFLSYSVTYSQCHCPLALKDQVTKK